MKASLRVAYLYPDLMNLYADRGNVICLRQRCLRRDIEVVIDEIGLNDALDTAAYDTIYMGGGQDKEQRLVAEDLYLHKGDALREAAEKGVVILVICGGYQLFGHYYRPAEGAELPGIGIFDAWTVHRGTKQPRCIGNVIAEWEGELLVGFENHGGRSYLGPSARPLAKVVHGHGNNSEDGGEGAIYKNCFGTYLHGSLLPKNPHFADHLLHLALQRKYPGIELAPLDDRLELQAHQAAIERIKRQRRLKVIIRG